VNFSIEKLDGDLSGFVHHVKEVRTTVGEKTVSPFPAAFRVYRAAVLTLPRTVFIDKLEYRVSISNVFVMSVLRPSCLMTIRERFLVHCRDERSHMFYYDSAPPSSSMPPAPNPKN